MNLTLLNRDGIMTGRDPCEALNAEFRHEPPNHSFQPADGTVAWERLDQGVQEIQG
jgi:hypothetical protein